MIQKKDHIGNQQGLKLSGVTDEVNAEEAARRTAELKRCYDSVDYFAEHYFTIVNTDGEIVPIKLYKKQSELIHKFQDNTNVIVLSPRQVGKSVSYSIFFTHCIIFKKNYSILIAANKAKSAKGVLKKIKDAYEQIPNWMKPGIVEWNKQSITFDNGVKIEAEATSDSTGRSGTNDCICLDEFSFVRPSVQESFWESVVPTISSRGKNAKLFVVSTPNGCGDKYHEIWKEANTSKDTVWIPHRIDWWDVPGRTEEWHQKEIKRLGSEESFQKEYGCSFLVSNANKLITDERVISLKEQVENLHIVASVLPVDASKPDFNFSYTRYFPYDKTHTYVIGADCAEGTGQDASVAYVLDITRTSDIKLAAKFDSIKVIPEQYAYVVYCLWRIYGKPKLMVEANACGMAFIDDLKALSRSTDINPQFVMRDVINYNRPHPHTGINSNNQSKSKSMLNLQNIAQSNHYSLVLPDEELFRELPFCEKRSGSGNVTYRAQKGHHDDHILALNWGLFILSDELIEKYFTVEYAIDEDTKQKYPVLILPIGEDIDDYKSKYEERGELDTQELWSLAEKWKLLGDNQRADAIIERIYERETEDTGGFWGHNPYEIDPALFSREFRKKFLNGEDSGYFRNPVSDPHDLEYHEEIGFGWIV